MEPDFRSEAGIVLSLPVEVSSELSIKVICRVASRSVEPMPTYDAMNESKQ